MAKAPTQPSEIYGLFIDDCKAIFGDDLLSIMLFGSAARKDYQPKKSDINFLVVLSDSGMHKLKNVVPYLKKWHKRSISVPLFFTTYYLQSSLDSYPMEFLDFKLYHLVVYGEDYLKDIQINSSHLRLQCEREIKGKLIHLRQNFLTSGLKPKIMKQILVRTLPTFITIFEALLFLKNEQVPPHRKEVFQRISDDFELDASVFHSLIDLKSGRSSLKKEELISLFERYMENVLKLSKQVDKM